MGEVDPSSPSVLLHWLPTSCTTWIQKKKMFTSKQTNKPCVVVLPSAMFPRVFPSSDTYLEPPLGLLFTLNSQHQSFASRQREAQLVSLLPSFLRDVDDVAQIKRELSVGSALFDALIALWKRHIQRLWCITWCYFTLVLKCNLLKDFLAMLWSFHPRRESTWR